MPRSNGDRQAGGRESRPWILSFHSTRVYNTLVFNSQHYNDVIVSAVASQITGFWVVCSTVCSGADQRKHRSSASLTLCEGNSPVTGEFPSQRASDAENIFIWWRHHETHTEHKIHTHRQVAKTSYKTREIKMPTSLSYSPNFKAIGKLWTLISRVRYFARCYDQMRLASIALSEFYTVDTLGYCGACNRTLELNLLIELQVPSCMSFWLATP